MTSFPDPNKLVYDGSPFINPVDNITITYNETSSVTITSLPESSFDGAPFISINLISFSINIPYSGLSGSSQASNFANAIDSVSITPRGSFLIEEVLPLDELVSDNGGVYFVSFDELSVSNDLASNIVTIKDWEDLNNLLEVVSINNIGIVTVSVEELDNNTDVLDLSTVGSGVVTLYIEEQSTALDPSIDVPEFIIGIVDV